MYLIKRRCNLAGGRFEYQQYRIKDIAETIKEDIIRLENNSEYLDWVEDRKTLIVNMKQTYITLLSAYTYVQRLDWLLSGDDGEESFKIRLEEDLRKVISENEDLINDLFQHLSKDK